VEDVCKYMKKSCCDIQWDRGSTLAPPRFYTTTYPVSSLYARYTYGAFRAVTLTCLKYHPTAVKDKTFCFTHFERYSTSIVGLDFIRVGSFVPGKINTFLHQYGAYSLSLGLRFVTRAGTSYQSTFISEQEPPIRQKIKYTAKS
jgi:hypothetical protein